MEESEDGLDEWRDLVVSPKGLFSGFSSEPCVAKSIADVFTDGNEILGGDDGKEVENSVFDSGGKLEDCGQELNSSVIGDDLDVGHIGGNIGERRAAKFGFNDPKISTPHFKSSSPLSSPGSHSPYLINAAGINPIVLLDSPNLVPNSQASPTKGTFTSPTQGRDNQMLIPASSGGADKDYDDGTSSMFKADSDAIPIACFHAVENQVPSPGGLAQSLVANVDGQSITSMQPPVNFEFHMQFPNEVTMKTHDIRSPSDGKISDDITVTSNPTTLQPCNSTTLVCVQMQEKAEPSLEEDAETPNSLDAKHKGSYAPTGTVRTAEDGYNWRKYGQKQVKGSEYPRSYYKCTHPNCQVKKKVERSHDGQITEIIYKGAHNHPKPQPCRKSSFGSSLSFRDTSDIGDGSVSCVKAEGGSVWRNIQSGCNGGMTGSDWRTDGLDKASPTSVVTEASDLMSTNQGRPMCVLESAGTPEFSSTIASNEDDEEDAATQGSFSLVDDDDNEPDSKRRKKEACFIETTLGSRAVREPRVVIQIESDIDILDDGYRWRKYGQKVVKGNPNPRSYYKCTRPGCTVRKHVERASHNLKFVLMTYEGKHNHEVPAARNSCHANSSHGGLPPPASNTQSPLTLPRNPHLPKPEPHVQDLSSHFDRKMECNGDFLGANFLGNLRGGASPFYQMKFPTLPNSAPYGPFGLGTHQPAFPNSMVQGFSDLSIPLPLGFPRSSNLAMANYTNPGRPISSIQPLIGGHHHEEHNGKLLRPKQEQGDDSFYDTGMHNIDHTISSSSSIYNHIV